MASPRGGCIDRGCSIVTWPYIFFFQAEDGIRDYKVTGVQTCALPISHCPAHPFSFVQCVSNIVIGGSTFKKNHALTPGALPRITALDSARPISEFRFRSEERRVGKECRSRWSPYH